MNEWNTLPFKFKDRITGKLLGDGGISKQNGRQPRFHFIHAFADKEWGYYCYETLKEVLPLAHPKYKKVTDVRLKKGYSESIQCQSRTSPLINLLEDKWYKNRKKRIPFDLLKESLGIECLAWWYQDDGHLKLKNGHPTKIILSTESFTNKENMLLIQLLHQKLHLSFSIDKKNRLALYGRASIQYFLSLVNPYIQPCMQRKKVNVSPQIYELPAKRTTLYLPSEHNLSTPTKEINNSLNYLVKLWKTYLDDKFYKNIYLPYHARLNINENNQLSYQIIVKASNASYLYTLKQYTGLTYSQLAHLTFILQKGPK